MNHQDYSTGVRESVSRAGLSPGVVVKATKTFALQPVEFEYRVQREESMAVVLILPQMRDGGRVNCVERVQVLRVISVFYLGETTAESRQAVPGSTAVLRSFLEDLINHSPQDLAMIDAIHRRLVGVEPR